MSRARVVSPLNGIVVKRFLSIGEQADGTAAQPILEVANLEEVELQGNVPALYLAKVKQGQNFEVKAEQYAAKPLAATVVAISPSVDPGSDIGMVRIRIANSLHVLRLGMFLTVQLPIQTQMNTLYVPAQAVYRGQSGETHVYRVKGDAVEEIAVRLGVQTLDRVEILSGVQAGDTIVLEGGYGLADHAKVKTKP